jgi:hypothetical protein
MSVAAGFVLCVDLSRDERGRAVYLVERDRAVYLVGHMCWMLCGVGRICHNTRSDEANHGHDLEAHFYVKHNEIICRLFHPLP